MNIFGQSHQFLPNIPVPHMYFHDLLNEMQSHVHYSFVSFIVTMLEFLSPKFDGNSSLLVDKNHAEVK